MTKEKILSNYNPIPHAGCHIWDNYLDNGYGQVWFQEKLHLAHRLIYEFKNGSIPKGVMVCHVCDTPSCVNPDHLFLGTQKDNMGDCVSKGRISRGGSRWNAKLTEGQVIKIRALLKEGVVQREIAQEFGIAPRAVSDINTGQNWGWVK